MIKASLVLLLPCLMCLKGQIIPAGSLDRGSGVTLSLPNATINPVLSSLSAINVGEVNFTDTTPINLQLKPDQTATTRVDVIASMPVSAGVSFYLDLVRSSDKSPCRGTVAPMTLSTALSQNVAKTIPIEITGCPGYGSEGKLVILGSTGTARERKISVRRWIPVWLIRSLVHTFVLSMVLILICTGIVIYHGHRLDDPIGGASWDFSNSWASNVTAFSAAFAFLIQLSIFPEKPVFGSRTEYFLLTGFSLALVTLAPAVNRAISSVDGAGTHSIVGGFLVASLITVWGSMLQTSLQLVILSDLGVTATISEKLVRVVVASIVVGWLALVYYCWSTILWTVASNAARSGTKLGTFKTFAIAAPSAMTAASGSISVL